jgi:hypothetical protein
MLSFAFIRARVSFRVTDYSPAEIRFVEKRTLLICQFLERIGKLEEKKNQHRALPCPDIKC